MKEKGKKWFKKKIWTDSIEEAELEWQRKYLPFGADIDQPIDVKFDWRKLKWRYVFTVKWIIH